MSGVEIDRVLSQMRQIQAQAQARPQAAAPAGAAPTDKAEPAAFGRLLTQALDQVNRVQGDAASLTSAFEKGDPDVALPDVMLARAESKVAFKGAVEVRNRLVAAYQDIMKMPV